LAILEQRFPETMQARCSWCGDVQIARDGTWVEVFVSSPGTGVASTHVFRCRLCVHTESKGRGVGTGIVAVPRKARPVPQGDEEGANAASVEAHAKAGAGTASAERAEPAEPAAKTAEPVAARAEEIVIRDEPELDVAEEPLPEMAGAGIRRP
jgi:hypothetical protein